jgi:DNA-binding NarL/FixJ family response regulator
MDQGRSAARCEALALLALEASRLGADRNDEALLALAERSARDAKTLAILLPGHPHWSAQADAALARVSMARGAREEALESGRSALTALAAGQREDAFLDTVLPAAAAVLAAGTEEEITRLRVRLRTTLAFVSGHMVDQKVRAAWFRSPSGRELTRMAAVEAPEAASPQNEPEPISLTEEDLSLLAFLGQGLTNAEIAEAMGVGEESVDRKLNGIYAKMGAKSRANATTAALLGGLI